MRRVTMIDRLRDRSHSWDIVVIGGGATGMGIAVDAASRRLDVLLVEQSDFGKGTSSRSTKLVHGGVRYLQQQIELDPRAVPPPPAFPDKSFRYRAAGTGGGR